MQQRRLLARRRRRRHLHVRDRALLRLDGRHPPQPARARHGAHRDRDRATGCSPPTAASSASATRTFYGSLGGAKLSGAGRVDAAHRDRQGLLDDDARTATSSASATPRTTATSRRARTTAARRAARDARRQRLLDRDRQPARSSPFGDAKQPRLPGLHRRSDDRHCSTDRLRTSRRRVAPRSLGTTTHPRGARGTPG